MVGLGIGAGFVGSLAGLGTWKLWAGKECVKFGSDGVEGVQPRSSPLL